MDARFRLPFGWRQCRVEIHSGINVDGRQYVVVYTSPSGESSLQTTGLRWSKKLGAHYEYLPPGSRGAFTLSTLTLPVEVNELLVRIVPWQGGRADQLSFFTEPLLHVTALEGPNSGQSAIVKPESAGR